MTWSAVSAAPSDVAAGGRADVVAAWAVTAAFVLVALAAPAGGLGMSPVVILASVFGIGTFIARRRLPLPERPILIATTAFIAWAAVTSAWSPYEKIGTIVEFAVYTPIAFTFLALAATIGWRRRARTALVMGVFGGATVIMVEVATGGALTATGRNPPSPEQLQEMIWRNLGHGLSVLVILLPPAVAAAWTGGAWARVAVAWTALAVVIAGVVTGMSANLVGLATGAAGAALCALAPRTGIRALGVLTAASLLLAPVLGPLSRALTPWASEALPLSWLTRLRGWEAVASRVWEAPFLGHGFDAARRLEVIETHRGLTFDVVRLHPHNAGLHLWYDVGAVGVALACAAILLVAWRVAGAALLTRRQAIAVGGAIGAYVGMSQLSYGVWQEWWIALAVAAAAGCLLLGPAARRAP